jgi:Lon protease-like protein
VEGAEHRVGPAGAGANRIEVVDGGHARVQHELAVERAPDGLEPTTRERADVRARVDRLGAELTRETGQLTLRRSVAEGDPAEPFVELLEAFEHEARPRGRRVTAIQQPRVEAKHRHDAVVLVERCAQRRVVVRAQVPRQPHQGGHGADGSLKGMTRTIERFPLFPLGLVLLPQELVPLHIFEDRYKLMIGECLDEESEFGIIWLSDDGLKDTGCSARIARVLERFDDGRLNILVQGTEPFRLLRKIEDLPYPAGDIEVVVDDDGADDEAADKARRRYADLVEELTESRPEDDALAQLDAYGMAATLDVEPAAKQELLELRSERGRLEQLDTLFAEALERIRLAEFAAERARGNGHLPT